MPVRIVLAHYVTVTVSLDDEARCSKDCEYYLAPTPTIRQCTLLNRTIPLTRDLERPDNPYRSDLCMNTIELRPIHKEVTCETAEQKCPSRTSESPDSF